MTATAPAQQGNTADSGQRANEHPVGGGIEHRAGWVVGPAAVVGGCGYWCWFWWWCWVRWWGRWCRR